ncbi:MAG: MFS transporter [Pyramidobacter sp.]|nr:MFS transporter [Pyramidobacter sp.]
MQNVNESSSDTRGSGMRNVLMLGLVSFFADISSQMVYPLIPLYLTSAFGATPALVGIVEGIAESVASILKVFSGYVSDRFKHKKALAFAGYCTGLFYKLVLLSAGSWGGVLAARVIDRFGKGVRVAPRDAMVAESASKKKMGGAFGIHKMLDMAGSALGILLAFFIMRSMGDLGYKTVFAASIVPVAVALSLFVFIRENREAPAPAHREPFWRNIAQLDGQLKLYLAVTFLFTLGNSSNAFLLLRASQFGFDSSETVLLYFLYHVAASVLAVPCGRLSDALGRKKLLVWGYAVFSLVYFGFAGSVKNFV